jgi:hypothetical protein
MFVIDHSLVVFVMYDRIRFDVPAIEHGLRKAESAFAGRHRASVSASSLSACNNHL